MTDDSYQNPKPGKVYMSPALQAFNEKMRRVRIASKVTTDGEGYDYAKERGEVILRHKENAKTCIRAKFLEDTRGIFVLTIQKFDNDTGMPVGSGFSFVGEEIPRLLQFISDIRSVAFEDRGGFALSDDELRQRVLTASQAQALFKENEDIFAEVIRTAITKEDVIALAYRRRQLDVFDKLLSNKPYFEEVKAKKKCSDERLWQLFFEKNPWIFGYGLQYIYGSALDQKKLEQVVRGHTALQPGKRVDALLKSKAIASTLCFVEIKHHKTELLSKQAYRPGCYSPSAELTGAVAQIQATVSFASETLFGRRSVMGDDDFPTGETVFNFAPRSFVIAGSLAEFVRDGGVSEDRLRGFELYRSNLHQPEVFTFDELLERARHIVELGEAGGAAHSNP